VVLAGLESVAVELGLAGARAGVQRGVQAEVRVAVRQQDLHRAAQSPMRERVAAAQHLLHVHQPVVLTTAQQTTQSVLPPGESL